MKVVKNSKEAVPAYAIGVATGVSASTGRKYANVLLSSTPKVRRFSSFSVYLDPEDPQEALDKLGLSELSFAEDGSRKVTLLESAVEYSTGIFCTVLHAPYGYRDANGNRRIIRSTSFFLEEGSDTTAEAEANRLLTRAYDREDIILFKNKEYYAEYRQFVLFEMSEEDIQKYLLDSEEEEED